MRNTDDTLRWSKMACWNTSIFNLHFKGTFQTWSSSSIVKDDLCVLAMGIYPGDYHWGLSSKFSVWKSKETTKQIWNAQDKYNYNTNRTWLKARVGCCFQLSLSLQDQVLSGRLNSPWNCYIHTFQKMPRTKKIVLLKRGLRLVQKKQISGDPWFSSGTLGNNIIVSYTFRAMKCQHALAGHLVASSKSWHHIQRLIHVEGEQLNHPP